jgi:hypothetical protein
MRCISDLLVRGQRKVESDPTLGCLPAAGASGRLATVIKPIGRSIDEMPD